MTSPAQRTRRRQRREETREQIVAAAKELLAEQHFRELSVDAVMSRTQHSRTVFYRHFDDVAHLTLEVLQELGEELTEVSERFRQIADSEEGTAEDGLGAVVDLFVVHGRVLRGVSEAAHHDEEIDAANRALLSGFATMTAEAIESMQSEGRVDADLDAQELGRALTYMNERYLLASFGREPLADRDRVLRTLVTVWRRTVYASDVAVKAPRKS